MTISRVRNVLRWAFLGLVVAVLLLPWIFREPHYGGRSLSEWLGDKGFASDLDHLLGSRAPSSSTAEHLRARDAAIRAMGPRAVPQLLRMLSARETALQEFLRELRNRFLGGRIPSHWELHNRAMVGLQILGPAAAPAFPQILQLLEQEPQRVELWYILREIGPASAGAAPLLKRAFPRDPHDKDFHPQWLISDLSMSWGTTWREAVREDLVTKTNSTLHRVSCLWALRRDPEYARSFIPVLQAILADRSEPAFLKTACLHALGRIPALDSNVVHNALVDYETAFGSLPSDSILNGNFTYSNWSGTNQPPNDPPAPSDLMKDWLTWSGVVGRNLAATTGLKLELGPRMPPGAISQVFRTTPGAKYVLKFEGATGRNTHIDVSIGSLATDCVPQSADPTKPTLLSFEFRALSPLTTLTFSTPELDGYGPLIDNVSVSRTEGPGVKREDR